MGSEERKLADGTDESDELQTSDLAVSPDLSNCGDDSGEGGHEVTDDQARNGDSSSVIHNAEEGTYYVMSSVEKERSYDELNHDVLEEEVKKSYNDLENDGDDKEEEKETDDGELEKALVEEE